MDKTSQVYSHDSPVELDEKLTYVKTYRYMMFLLFSPVLVISSPNPTIAYAGLD